MKEKIAHDLFSGLEVTSFCISSTIKKEKTHLMDDIKRLKQDKQALEVDLEKVRRERDQAKDQIAYATGEHSRDRPCSLVLSSCCTSNRNRVVSFKYPESNL